MYAKRVRGYAAIGYKTKIDAEMPNAGNIIFNTADFLPIFTTDLLSAKREVMIVSPFLTKSRLTKMLKTFDGIISSGAKITIVTRQVNEQLVQMLKFHKIEVIENPKIHQKFAVIDRFIAWYGYK